MATRDPAYRPAGDPSSGGPSHLHRRSRLPLPAPLTNLPDTDIAFIEALHRGRGRCERVIRDLKDTGLGRLPSAEFSTNEAWLAAVLIAGDLLAWFRGLCLTGRLRRATPSRLRYTLLHVAGRLVRSGRRLILRLAASWPWTHALVAALTRCRQLTPST